MTESTVLSTAIRPSSLTVSVKLYPTLTRSGNEFICHQIMIPKQPDERANVQVCSDAFSPGAGIRTRKDRGRKYGIRSRFGTTSMASKSCSEDVYDIAHSFLSLLLDC